MFKILVNGKSVEVQDDQDNLLIVRIPVEGFTIDRTLRLDTPTNENKWCTVRILQHASSIEKCNSEFLAALGFMPENVSNFNVNISLSISHPVDVDVEDVSACITDTIHNMLMHDDRLKCKIAEFGNISMISASIH